MRVLVYSTKFKEEHIPFITTLFNALDSQGFTTFVEYEYLQKLQENSLLDNVSSISNHAELKEANIDYVITLGGDGTILKVITLIQDLEIPILGINLGRLGFLSNVEKTMIDRAIMTLAQKEYRIESRKLLHFNSEGQYFDFPFALNEMTVAKRDTSSMITVHTYIDDKFLNSYWADGVILSTPTGSTGYNLSCGGPILFPDSNAFIITPIAPHNLNVRPIVIPDDKKITFHIEGRSENYLCTLDSRYQSVTSDYTFHIQKSDFQIKFVLIDNINFMSTMRNKLMWGLDKRNF